MIFPNSIEVASAIRPGCGKNGVKLGSPTIEDEITPVFPNNPSSSSNKSFEEGIKIFGSESASEPSK